MAEERGEEKDERRIKNERVIRVKESSGSASGNPVSAWENERISSTARFKNEDLRKGFKRRTQTSICRVIWKRERKREGRE